MRDRASAVRHTFSAAIWASYPACYGLYGITPSASEDVYQHGTRGPAPNSQARRVVCRYNCIMRHHRIPTVLVAVAAAAALLAGGSAKAQYPVDNQVGQID